MNQIPRSYQPNPQEFKISDIFTNSELKTPTNSELLTLITKLLKFSLILSQKSCDEIFFLIQEIKTSKDLTPEMNDKVNLILKQVACQKCFSSPKNLQKFSFLLCDRCYDDTELGVNPRCYYCQCSYLNPKYQFDCKHFCVFCAAFIVRKGIGKCPVCETLWDADQLSNQKFKCSKCSKRGSLLDDYMFRLPCKHFHCFDCLLFDVKNKACVTDDYKFDGSLSNFILNYITGKCIQCNERKFRVQLVIKDCCFFDVCQSCQHGCLICIACQLDNSIPL